MDFTTQFVGWNPAHGYVNSIQLYVIKFVSDLRQGQVVGFLPVLRFPPKNKTGNHDINDILLKVASNTINLIGISEIQSNINAIFIGCYSQL